jgi:ATP-dependent protease HslVU (ClpYQ) peptidase subunit
MTCIVGIEHGGRVLMGGDVQGTGFNTKVMHTQPKVFRKNGILFGFCGSYRFGQLIEHGLKEPIAPDNDAEIYRWLVTVLVPDIRKSLKDEGYEQGGNCLVGVRGQLWELQADFSVLRSVKGYGAVGSGYEYALGSVFTSVNFCHLEHRDNVERAIKRAITVAGTFSPSVGTDATVLST